MFNIYTVMLLSSLIAITVACLLMVLELGHYGFVINPTRR